MKHKCIIYYAVCSIVIFSSVPAFAQETKSAESVYEQQFELSEYDKSSDTAYEYDINKSADYETNDSSKKISYDISDIINKDDIYYVPLRKTAEALDISVDWNMDKRTATISNDSRTMDITEGKDLYISSTTIENAVGMTAPLKLGAAPFIDEYGNMQVPAEAFNALVGYSVTIDDKEVTISQQ